MSPPSPEWTREPVDDGTATFTPRELDSVGCAIRSKVDADVLFADWPRDEAPSIAVIGSNVAPDLRTGRVSRGDRHLAVLPTDPAERKGIPIATGVLDYFPAALAEIAKVSKAGNDQHNPGEPLHHARGKSTDQADTIIRHFLERGTVDADGMRHSAKLAWRVLALLQLELEAAGAPLARGARQPEPAKGQP